VKETVELTVSGVEARKAEKLLTVKIGSERLVRVGCAVVVKRRVAKGRRVERYMMG
jgi:hypothetical protein